MTERNSLSRVPKSPLQDALTGHAKTLWEMRESLDSKKNSLINKDSDWAELDLVIDEIADIAMHLSAMSERFSHSDKSSPAEPLPRSFTSLRLAIVAWWKGQPVSAKASGGDHEG